MFSINFPTYSRLDALNSLVTKCVHILCSPVDVLQQNKQTYLSSSLYDLNIVNRYERIAEAPYRLIENLYAHYRLKNYPNNFNEQQSSLLDINSRQMVIDYIIRERIFVSANFIIKILEDGGVYNFDLWKLCKINGFSCQEIEKIFKIMFIYSKCFRQLSLGGIGWIYHFNIINGCLKKFLCKNSSLVNLKVLKIQQISFGINFISLLRSCPNLVYLEIAEPSLKDYDIFKMFSYLSSNGSLSVCESLRYVMFPSSVKEQGLMYFLACFPNITHLRCTPFEQLLDLLYYSISTLSSLKHILAQKTINVLKNIRALSIAHPMSHNTVNRLISICPKIEELSLELQKNMNLLELSTGAPFLQKLELHNSANKSISFMDHVVPILKGCGKQMKVLSLINFDQIDLTICAQYCPNLHTFSAQCFTVITIQLEQLRLINIKRPFGNLKHLRLRPRPNYLLPVNICIFMIQYSPKLKHIELYCCSEFTDENIDQIYKTNRLEKLETFILRDRHNVTNRSLCRLQSFLTSLNNLVFHDCGLVPEIKNQNF